jgi:hypothetical protein
VTTSDPKPPALEPDVDAVVVTTPEKKEDERDYVFWRCFNAFYIACIHLVIYITLVPFLRKKDKMTYDVYTDPRLFKDLIDNPRR